MDRNRSALLERKSSLTARPQFQRPKSEWEIGKYALLGVEATVQAGRTVIWPTVRRIPYQWPGVLHYQDHDDQPFMILHNSSGGFVEGDIAQFQMHSQAGTRVLMTTSGANRFYKCDNGGHCEDHIEIHLGEDCLLEYLPDEVIPYSRASFSRSTWISGPASARVFVSDVLTAGRQHYGEAFSFNRMRSEMGLNIGGRLCWLDRQLADSTESVRDLEALWGGYQCMGTIVAYSPNSLANLCDEIHDRCISVPEAKAAVTCIDERIVCLRILTDEAWLAHELIFDVWGILRPQLAAKPARRISKP